MKTITSLKIGKNVANTLNEYFINIAECTLGRQNTALPSQDIEIFISEIINKHENHISIQNVRNNKLNSTSTFEKTTSTNIRQLILELNSRKLKNLWELNDSTENYKDAKGYTCMLQYASGHF